MPATGICIVYNELRELHILICVHTHTHTCGAAAPGGRPHSMHYARIGRGATQIRPRRKMHDFGDLGRALEMVALLLGVALGG